MFCKDTESWHQKETHLTDFFAIFVENADKNPYMQKLVIIDACMREESRTRRILGPIADELGKKYETQVFRLDEMDDMPTVGKRMLHERSVEFKVPDWAVDAARTIAAADRIVIAAPFWDMSFPARLKSFVEHTSLFNITFANNGKECYGLCKCEKVLYITTRGMNIHTGDALEQGTPYIKALSALWGLGEVMTVAAENLDYSTPEEIERKIAAAVSEGLEICSGF